MLGQNRAAYLNTRTKIRIPSTHPILAAYPPGAPDFAIHLSEAYPDYHHRIRLWPRQTSHTTAPPHAQTHIENAAAQPRWLRRGGGAFAVMPQKIPIIVSAARTKGRRLVENSADDILYARPESFFFVLISETPTLRRSRNRPIFCQNMSPRALGPNLSGTCCRVRQRSHIAGERAANGSLCVEQRCTQIAFFDCWEPSRKNAVKSRPQLVPTPPHLNSVLEQALVTTTAVGEAYC